MKTILLLILSACAAFARPGETEAQIKNRFSKLTMDYGREQKSGATILKFRNVTKGVDLTCVISSGVCIYEQYKWEMEFGRGSESIKSINEKRANLLLSSISDGKEWVALPHEIGELQKFKFGQLVALPLV